jgi:Fe-S cluster assembly scaffold protein SufB
VPSEVAEALVVRGFFAEVLEDLPIPSVGTKTLERISELLSLEGVSL